MENKKRYNEMSKLGFQGLSNWVLKNRVANFIENGASAISVRIPKKNGYVYSEADILRDEIISKIKTARNYEDLDNIGRKLNYAIDNGIYEVGIANLQAEASKKMIAIYNKLGEYSGE